MYATQFLAVLNLDGHSPSSHSIICYFPLLIFKVIYIYKGNMPMKLCQELWKDFLFITSFAHSLKSQAETPVVQTRHLSHQLLPTWLQMAFISERGSAGPWLSASLCSCSQWIMNRVDNLSLYIFFTTPGFHQA